MGKEILMPGNHGLEAEILLKFFTICRCHLLSKGGVNNKASGRCCKNLRVFLGHDKTVFAIRDDFPASADISTNDR